MKFIVFVTICIFAGASCTNDNFEDFDWPESDIIETEDLSNDIDIIEVNEPDEEDDKDNEEFFDCSQSETEEEDDDDYPLEEIVVPECFTYLNPVSTAVLKDPVLLETSGIAVSYQNPGILWVHNDSGNEASLFAIRFDGTIVAELVLDGAKNIDWEALSLNRCGRSECLFIADTGDNLLKRNDYSIIVVKEPILPLESFNLVINDDKWVEFPISYEGVPHQNSEAMAIDNLGAIYIFSKEIGITNVFKALALEKSGTEFKHIGSINTGAKVAGYPNESQPSLVTGADINRNGTRLLLRTYGIYTTDNDGIREYLFSQGNVEEIFSGSPVFVPEGRDIQGEAIAYDPFTGGYVHTSEFYNKVIDFDPNIWVINCGN